MRRKVDLKKKKVYGSIMEGDVPVERHAEVEMNAAVDLDA
jgi:hypothetical protein